MPALQTSVDTSSAVYEGSATVDGLRAVNSRRTMACNP